MTPNADDGARSRADLIRYYDQDAISRSRRPLPAERVGRREAFADRLIAEGRVRVLDVGLGPGLDAAAFRDRGLLVDGIDLSAEHVRLARQAGVRAQVASVQGLPFADGTFDAVWCMSVLMHLPDEDLHDALAEIRRVLDGGGLMALGTWGGDDTEGVNPDDTLDPPRYFSWRSDDSMRRAIAVHATIEEFDTWSVETDRGYTYQWCVARRV